MCKLRLRCDYNIFILQGACGLVFTNQVLFLFCMSEVIDYVLKRDTLFVLKVDKFVLTFRSEEFVELH